MNDNWKEKLIDLLSIPDFNDAFSFKAGHIPDQLFKYVSLSQKKEEKLHALSEDLVWVSDPARMNDPYDSGLYFLQDTLSNILIKRDFDDFAEKINMIRFFSGKEINEISKEENIMEGITKRLKQKYPDRSVEIDQLQSVLDPLREKSHSLLLTQFNKILRSSLRITCFSELPDSLLMWSHYAGVHTGICVAYDFSKLHQTDYANRFLYPVIYSQNFFDATTILTSDTCAPVTLPLLAALHKSPEWSYEKEWRIVVPGGLLDKDTYFRVPTPSAIYLGTRIGEEDRSLIRGIAFQKNIQIFQMKMNPFSFSLEPDLPLGSVTK